MNFWACIEGEMDRGPADAADSAIDVSEDVK